MRKTLWEKRIPTFLGLFLLIAAIGATTILTKSGRTLLPRATPTYAPKDVKITNVSDSSFTVAWTTDDLTTGAVKVGVSQDTADKTVLDERDIIAGKPGTHKVHSGTVTGLSPSTTYFFRIVAGETTFDNEGLPYSVGTAVVLPKERRQETFAKGAVVSGDGSEAKESLVFLAIEGAQALSTIVKDSGEFLLPLTLLRTVNLQSYYDGSPDDLVELTIIGKALEQSKVRTLFRNLENMPLVTLGKEYDFTATSPFDRERLATTSSSFKASPPKDASAKPSLVNPKEDAVFTDTKPLFKGTAKPGSTVTITIESEHAITVQVTAGADGSWTFQPKTPLPTGTHTITIRVPDASGVIQLIKRTFTVQALGSQVVEGATPSATPILTVSPTISPTTTPSPTVAITPILTPTPTIIVTVQPIPESGAVLPTLFLGIVGIAVSTLGLLLFILK